MCGRLRDDNMVSPYAEGLRSTQLEGRRKLDILFGAMKSARLKVLCEDRAAKFISHGTL